MSQQQWTSVDDYLEEMLIPADAVLQSALSASDDGGLPAYQVTACQGKMLMLLAKVMNAARILEVGTLGGYSTIWFARALPLDGLLVSLELEPHHAEVAKANIERAEPGVEVQIRVGPASESLAAIAAEQLPPFDLIFIDADKESNPEYFGWALKLSRSGTLIIVDNVVRDGAVTDPASDDASVQGVRRLNELIAAEPRVDATAIQTVGAKGYDGFTMALVTG